MINQYQSYHNFAPDADLNEDKDFITAKVILKNLIAQAFVLKQYLPPNYRDFEVHRNKLDAYFIAVFPHYSVIIALMHENGRLNDEKAVEYLIELMNECYYPAFKPNLNI